MADRKITGHTAITAAQVDPAADVFEIVDTSDTTDAASGTNKKMTVAEAKIALAQYGIFTREAANARYNNGLAVVSTSTTTAIVINSLRAYPINIPRVMSIDRIAVHITTGTTGNIRLGIYNDNGSGLPGTLALDSGNMAITGTGVLTATVSITLQPGVYWLAYVTDTANTLAGFAASGPFLNVLGFGSASFNAGIGNMVLVAHTFGALPDPFGAAGPAVVAMPSIALRFT